MTRQFLFRSGGKITCQILRDGNLKMKRGRCQMESSEWENGKEKEKSRGESQQTKESTDQCPILVPSCRLTEGYEISPSHDLWHKGCMYVF